MEGREKRRRWQRHPNAPDLIWKNRRTGSQLSLACSAEKVPPKEQLTEAPDQWTHDGDKHTVCLTSERKDFVGKVFELCLPVLRRLFLCVCGCVLVFLYMCSCACVCVLSICLSVIMQCAPLSTSTNWVFCSGLSVLGISRFPIWLQPWRSPSLVRTFIANPHASVHTADVCSWLCVYSWCDRDEFFPWESVLTSIRL